MKHAHRYFFYPCVFAFIVFLPGKVYSQDTIKARRDKPFLFFQVGSPTDTISLTKGNLYYIHFPDSFKDRLTIHVLNGQLLLKNDTLLELRYLAGLKYECFYEAREQRTGKKLNKTWEFKTRINGTSDYDTGKIFIQITDRMKVMLENTLYYRN